MTGKKKILLLAGILIVLVLAVAVVRFILPKLVPSDATSEPTSEPTSELSSSVEDVFTPMMGDRITFTSTVLNVEEGAVLVHARGALCWVSTTVQSDVPVPHLKVGDVIDYVHNGVVAESYPGQINFVYEIRLAQGEHPKLTYTLSPKVGQPKQLTVLTEENSELGCAIYYYGLDGMDATVEEQTMSLQHALAVGTVSAEYWLELAETDAKAGVCEKQVYKDGGSKLYRYENYALLKMNTIDGDRTMYIGTPDMTLDAVKEHVKDENLLVQVTVSKEEQETPKRMSTSKTEQITDRIVYYYNLDSVRVKTADGFMNLIAALDEGKADLNTIRSELVDIARKNEDSQDIRYADGVLEDGSWYTETRIHMEEFSVCFVGYQDRREVFFCAPKKGGGFASSVKDRIAAESATKG